MRPDDRALLPKTLGRPGFAADVEPVLQVVAGAGDRIAFETDDAVYAELHRTHDLAGLSAPINPVTGPVYVDVAGPGDVLVVTVHEIRLADCGWSVSHAAGVHVTDRHVLEPRPMIGCVGVVQRWGRTRPCCPPTRSAATWTSPRSGRGRRSTCRSRWRAPCSRSATSTRSWPRGSPRSSRSRPRGSRWSPSTCSTT